LSFSLIPDGVYPNVCALQPSLLASWGITLLLADLDNTLAKYRQPEPDESIRAWKEALSASGITLFLLSNSRKPGRAARFAQSLGIPYLGHARKPRKAGFQQAMEQTGKTPRQTAMVGDQIFTDILGARRAGVLALLVEPVALAGNPGRYLRYAGETPFRALGRWRGRRRMANY